MTCGGNIIRAAPFGLLPGRATNRVIGRVVDKCQVTHYIFAVINSFRHNGLEKFFRIGKDVELVDHH